jgi:hypothetical protein
MQQNYTASGVIHAILPKEKRGNYNLQKVVLEVDGYKERKELPTFEFFGAKSDSVDAFQKGDECEITFNLAGRSNNDGDRWFVTLSAWKIVHPEQPHQCPNTNNPPRNRQPDRNFSQAPERPARDSRAQEQESRSRRQAQYEDPSTDIDF